MVGLGGSDVFVDEVFGWVFELGVLVEEHEGDFAGGAVSLLGEDQLGLSAQVFAVALVDFGAEDEGDKVGVLLDGSRFTEVAQLRAVIAETLLGGAAQLRENEEGEVTLTGSLGKPRRPKLCSRGTRTMAGAG